MQTGGEGYIANLKAAFAAVPALAAPLDELAAFAAAAHALGVEPRVVPATQRDFEYYTGPVFRLYAGGAAVGGGGRYDRLVTAGDGSPVRACGVALFIDRIAPLLPDERRRGAPFILVRPAVENAAGFARAAQAATELQRLGLSAGLAAGTEQARWTLTVGVAPPFLLAGRSAGAGLEAASLRDVAATVQGLQP